ncbi:Virulence factor Mce family protein [uncultured Mycobacterium sp.]|uniref:Virulence factor Mce family protein n=1 Tax=uncultured Mycobacterium sp. TaxID=171292 RepID=A0A1Y5P4S6_9MYCO|nr:Virulence factor Mce family protein [uncultured Mycobacterium sp.]
MLTRFVRIQLIIFTIASVVGLTVIGVKYLQAATLLGVGRLTVTLQLPASGGLYQFSNVTYRGVQIGKVTEVKVVDGRRVDATLSLDDSPRVPVDLVAHVRSISAVGEQFVDLQPNTERPPYLSDGSVIPMSKSSVPQQVGPMLDQLNNLVTSIPKERMQDLLDESFKAFNGTGYDFGSLIDSGTTLTHDLSGIAERNRTLVDDSAPLLRSQADSVDAIRIWAHSIAGLTGQLAQNDPQIRAVLNTGPGFADEVSQLLAQVKPTLPVLLASLTTVGQVGVTYHASIEQLLVLLPPTAANYLSITPSNNASGLPMGDFGISIGDPPACTVGFLPPSQWRSPADFTTLDTPDGLYCKLPQDSPLAVRGARNYPCMGHPGKRAPTVQICDSDKPYEPLAMRQHVVGPYPLDPNLIAQGVPPDSRVNPDDNIFGPLQGTPPPPGPTSAALPSAAPSAFHDPATTTPSVAIARYDRQTGAYMAPDGHLYHSADVVSTGPKAWTDLVRGPQ